MNPLFYKIKTKNLNNFLTTYFINKFYIKKFYTLFKISLYNLNFIITNLLLFFFKNNIINNNNFIMYKFSLFFFKLNKMFKNIKKFTKIWHQFLLLEHFNIKNIKNTFFNIIFLNYIKYLNILNIFYINSNIYKSVFKFNYFIYLAKKKITKFNFKIIFIINYLKKLIKITKFNFTNYYIFKYKLNIFYLSRLYKNTSNFINFNFKNLKIDTKIKYKELTLFFSKNHSKRNFWKKNKIKKHFLFYLQSQNIQEFSLFIQFSKKKQLIFFFYKFFLNQFKNFNFNVNLQNLQNLYLFFNNLKKNINSNLNKKIKIKNNNVFWNLNSNLSKNLNLVKNYLKYSLNLKLINSTKFLFFLTKLHYLKKIVNFNNNLILFKNKYLKKNFFNIYSFIINLTKYNFNFKIYYILKINKMHQNLLYVKYILKYNYKKTNLNIYFNLKLKKITKLKYLNFFKWKLNYFYLNTFIQKISFNITIRSTIHNLWISITSNITGHCLFQKSSGNFGFKHKNKMDFKVPIIMSKYYLKNFFKEKVKKNNYNILYYNILLKGARHNLVIRNQLLKLIKDSNFVFLGFFENPLVAHNGCLLKRKARKKKRGIKKKKIRINKKNLFRNSNLIYLKNRLNVLDKY